MVTLPMVAWPARRAADATDQLGRRAGPAIGNAETPAQGGSQSGRDTAPPSWTNFGSRDRSRLAAIWGRIARQVPELVVPISAPSEGIPVPTNLDCVSPRLLAVMPNSALLRAMIMRRNESACMTVGVVS
jgi:hypothetical protein